MRRHAVMNVDGVHIHGQAGRRQAGRKGLQRAWLFAVPAGWGKIDTERITTPHGVVVPRRLPGHCRLRHARHWLVIYHATALVGVI